MTTWWAACSCSTVSIRSISKRECGGRWKKLGPRLAKQGSEIELIGIDGGVVRLRVHAAGSNCGSSTGPLKAAVEEAILGAAPDVVQLLIDGLEETGTSSGFVPIETLMGNHSPALNGVKAL